MRASLARLAVAALLLLAIAPGARADFDPAPDAKAIVKCTRTINKETGKYLKQAQKLVDKCKSKVTQKGEGPGGETTLAECTVAAQLGLGPDGKLAKQRAKLFAGIAKQCGGKGKVCGDTEPTGPDDADVPLAAINWDIPNCMNFENSAAADCNVQIEDCGDIAACLACITDTLVEQAVDGLVYDQFDPTSFGPTGNADDPGKSRNKCQLTIAKATGKFLLAKQKILTKCNDGKLNGKVDKFDATLPCPDADLSSPNKSVAKIVKAESKKVSLICKHCGGGGVVGTTPPFTCELAEPNLQGVFTGPTGFIPDTVSAFACPEVSVPPNAVHPAGLDCGALDDGGATTGVDTLAEYVACVDCVLEYKADCASAAATGVNDAAGFPYPLECNQCSLDTGCAGPCLGGNTCALVETGTVDPNAPGFDPNDPFAGLSEVCTCVPPSLEPCADTEAGGPGEASCNGVCPAGESCAFFGLFAGCACVPDGTPVSCGVSDAPTCGGSCPAGLFCIETPVGLCNCLPFPGCGDVTAPMCGDGTCPFSFVTGFQNCVEVSPGVCGCVGPP
jgi:hypothetical protein